MDNSYNPARKIFLIEQPEIDCYVTGKLLELWLANVAVIRLFTAEQIFSCKKNITIDNLLILIDADLYHSEWSEFNESINPHRSRFSLYVLGNHIQCKEARKGSDAFVKNYIIKPIEKTDVMKIATENGMLLSPWI